MKDGGNFVHTLTLTDIHSGWTECAALVVREQSLVMEGINAVSERLPFALRGLDTDNDSAFMNEDFANRETIVRDSLAERDEFEISADLHL